MTFEMWSLGHYAFMLSPFILTAIFYLLSRSKTYEQKRKFGVVLSIIMVIILILRNAEILVAGDFAFNYEIIPLQICHFANFVLLYAFIKDSKAMFALALLFNLPAAFMSILFANSLTHYSNIWTLRGIAYIFGHMLIVSTTLWAFLERFVVLNKQTFKNTAFIVYALYIISVLVNNLIGSITGSYPNYFYALRPEEGTPLQTFYDIGTTFEIGKFMINPIYLILTALLGTVIVSMMYGLFKVLEPKKKMVLGYNQ